MPREKSHYRDRHSSSSSDSSYERKKYKTKHKRRSRSKDRLESSSHRRKRSSSYTRRKKRSYSRSSSRERYETKSRSKKSSRRSLSRERDSRSSSKSKTRHKSKHKSHRSRSSDRSSSSETEHSVGLKKTHMDDIESKVEKAIKAAEAAGLTMTKLPTYEYKEVEIKEDMPTIHDRNLLDELNSDSFTQKSFTSSRTKKFSQNIVIDLDSQTVRVPEIEAHVPKDDSIVNFDELLSEEELREMWVKKLYNYRKKMLKGEL